MQQNIREIRKNPMTRFALFDYIPSARLDKATFDEVIVHDFILSFKAGKRHAQMMAAYCVARHLGKMENVVFVCIPASSKAKTKKRYEYFIKEVTKQTRMTDGTKHLQICGNKKGIHLRRTHYHKEENYQVLADKKFFEGKKCIVFDDITTTGKTADKMNELLTEAGARVIWNVFLGKTKKHFKC